ncbi:MAG: hypothetical protein AAFQ63_24090 [Cyanobacteria bacterium J06621_11]
MVYPGIVWSQTQHIKAMGLGRRLHDHVPELPQMREETSKDAAQYQTTQPPVRWWEQHSV